MAIDTQIGLTCEDCASHRRSLHVGLIESPAGGVSLNGTKQPHVGAGRSQVQIPGRRLRAARRGGHGSSAPARTDVWLARVERPVDAEIAGYARLGQPPD